MTNNHPLTNGEDYAFAKPSCDELAGQLGLTKREYFAACALQGILSSSAAFSIKGKDLYKIVPDDIIAVWATGYADALINDLNEGD